jgi:ABC-type glutathione transport system ATPase component
MSALLEVRDVCKTYRRGGLFSARQIEAVKHVSFHIDSKRPEIFTVIGESGSGKTTLARMVLGIIQPSSGTLVLDGQDLVALGGRASRMTFMRKVQPIFQNPFEAFNPLKQLDHYLFVTARRFRDAPGPREAHAFADEALRQVGLSLGEVRGRFPHELSGGQLQRVAIARALVSRPRLIVADEPVSMVDASLRMSIVNLFRKLRDDLGISIIYITHDLATAYTISDRLIIMEKGRVVEEGVARAVLTAPTHPYTRELLDAVLTPEAAKRPLTVPS